MRRVHAYSFLGQAKERGLLGVTEGERFEAAEDDRVCGWKYISLMLEVDSDEWTYGTQRRRSPGG